MSEFGELQARSVRRLMDRRDECRTWPVDFDQSLGDRTVLLLHHGSASNSKIPIKPFSCQYQCKKCDVSSYMYATIHPRTFLPQLEGILRFASC
jgi:hypothetical protein